MQETPSRIIRHQHFNDITARSLTAARRADNEGVSRSITIGRHVSNYSLYQSGKMLVWNRWDVTVVSTLWPTRISQQERGKPEKWQNKQLPESVQNMRGAI